MLYVAPMFFAQHGSDTLMPHNKQCCWDKDPKARMPASELVKVITSMLQQPDVNSSILSDYMPKPAQCVHDEVGRLDGG